MHHLGPAYVCGSSHDCLTALPLASDYVLLFVLVSYASLCPSTSPPPSLFVTSLFYFSYTSNIFKFLSPNRPRADLGSSLYHGSPALSRECEPRQQSIKQPIGLCSVENWGNGHLNYISNSFSSWFFSAT